MNRIFALCVLGLLFAAFSADRSEAVQSKDEVNLTRELAQLDKTASAPAGEAAVIKRITKDLGVGADRIAALRTRGLGLGEVTVVLSLAQKMAGGITDANIDRVIALYSGPPAMGWGEIAKQLGVRLGVAVTQVKKVNNGAHREMKTDHEAHQSPRKETEPSMPPREPTRSFTGEGRDMTRGNAAK